MERRATSNPSASSRTFSRRALLGALGLGAAPGNLLFRQLAGAQSTPETGGAPGETRAPGGPNLDDLLWELEYDPEKIFRYVADEIAYEAYAGALRGAKGTHWSLAGNSVDQAMLLAEMLTRAEVSVRFVAGELDETAATELAGSMAIDAAAVKELIERVGAGGQAALGRHPGITPEQRAALDSPEQMRVRLLDRAGEQLQEGVDLIEQALAAEKIELPEVESGLPERERRQHVWVQYAAGAEWVDLDPSFPNTEPGKTRAEPAETWDAIPDDLYHLVRFRAIVENEIGGTPTREESFMHEARAADLVGVPVVFAHVDPNAFKKLGFSILGAIDGSLQYVPTLLAGEAGAYGDAVTLGAGSGALDVLGGDELGVRTIGEWLEIEVLPIDAPATTTVREIFDRVGVDRRAAGDVDVASLPPVELVDDPQLGTVFLPLETVMLIGVVGGRVPGSYFDQDFGVDDIEADMALMVHGYFAARERLQADIAAGRGYRWYHDQPNVTAGSLAPVKGEGDVYNLTATLDLIHQGYGIVPLAGGTPDVQPRVLAGVLAHVAERIGSEVGRELDPTLPETGGSVGRVFEAAGKAGIAVRTLRPDSAADLAGLSVSDVAKARISEALSAGYVVVVPERSVELGGMEQVGWWQVDPATGRTFDLMENGRGGSPIGEDTVIIVGGPAWRAALAWKVLSFVIGVIVGFSTVMAITMYPN